MLLIGLYYFVRDDAPSQAFASSGVTMETMETVVAVAIGILAAVFVGALIILVVICRRQKGSGNFINKQCRDMRWVQLYRCIT